MTNTTQNSPTNDDQDLPVVSDEEIEANRKKLEKERHKEDLGDGLDDIFDDIVNNLYINPADMKKHDK
ncbi:MAG: hypothetical protein HYV41_00860 [Candidatus Magasanikbacteria bacterium]|nr:hypothetical protein [Candidatus Magasanikbacteria bacterium]